MPSQRTDTIRNEAKAQLLVRNVSLSKDTRRGDYDENMQPRQVHVSRRGSIKLSFPENSMSMADRDALLPQSREDDDAEYFITESNVLKGEEQRRIVFESEITSARETCETHDNEGVNFMTILKQIFLPIGYPHTVEDGYATYQFWDTVQGLSSYLRGQLAIQAMLEGFGVGDRDATAVAGALGWVLRDGASMIGGLCFSTLVSADLGRRVRQWRLFADIINDVGLTLNMIAPIFGKRYFLILACCGSMCTTVCGIAAGATKVKISSHFAKRNNLSDIVAKEGAQETFVNIIGLVCGYLFLQLLEYQRTYRNDIDTPWFFWWEPSSSVVGVVNIKTIAFVALTLLHVFANILAMRATRMRTINGVRFDVLFDSYVHACEMRKQGRGGSNKDALNIDVVSQKEPLLPWCLLSSQVPTSSASLSHRVRLGVSVKSIQDHAHSPGHVVVQLKATRKPHKYVLVHQKEQQTGIHFISVLLHKSANTRTILQAKCHAQLFLRDLCLGSSKNIISVHATNPTGTKERATNNVAIATSFVRKLESQGWDIVHCDLDVEGWRYDWWD